MKHVVGLVSVGPVVGRSRRRQRLPVGASKTVAGLCLLLIGTACQFPARGAHPATATPSNSPIASSARIHITPEGGRANVKPDGRISVTVEDGTLTSVKVHTSGDLVDGTLNPGATAWRSSWALNTDTRYMVQARAVDQTGLAATATSSFRTLDPTRTFSTTIFEGYRKTYGVGMPIILTFSSPITNKRAVERSLELRTSKPVVGAWYWDGDQTLYFRPRSYWPSQTQVRFTGHLDGVEGAHGVYGVHTLTQSFSIGRSLIAVASTVTHHVRIYLDRRLFGDWPISAGRPGDDTPNGTYLTIEKANPEDMIGPGYNIEVPWSVRFTWSGDFMHDAYWSVGQQGFENVSHGCVNLSPQHAEVYYKLAVPGDPVTIAGSPRGGTWDNGWTVWFLTWAQLLQGSALNEAVRASPEGSRFLDRAALRPSRAKPPLGTSRPGNAAPA